MLLAPPPILETRESLPWGFQGAEERSKKLPALLSKVAELAGPRVSFFDLGSVAAMSSDGVHLDQDAQRPVAEALAEKQAAEAQVKELRCFYRGGTIEFSI